LPRVINTLVMKLSYQNTVADTVAKDYRAAAIFEKYGIDFCCHGKVPIEEACEQQSVQTEEVMREFILFPRIRKIEALTRNPMESNTIQPGVLRLPIDMMMNEHSVEGNRFMDINELTQHYQAPADACNTFKVTYALLQEFENDLHLHIHLENNILFPKALEMEKSLSPCGN
jgi:iron-sulfur cluster repair protein YtfE (RIC family)